MLRLFTILIATTSLVSCRATSPQSNHAPGQSGNYIGAKAGILNINRDLPFSNGGSVGFLVGHDFPGNEISLEVEATLPVSSAGVDNANFGDLDVFTLGVFGAYRTKGDLFFKGKLGMVYEYLSIDGGSFGLEGDAINLALGAGLGYRINDTITVEAEYTSIEADIAFASIGMNFAL